MRRAVLVACCAAAVAASAREQPPPRAPEYDPAAEVTVRGVVTDIHESKAASDHPGLHLIMECDGETLEVHACPVRFLAELEFSIAKGDTLSVVGARSRKGAVIVAREITKGQLSLILRDRKGVPNWLPR